MSIGGFAGGLASGLSQGMRMREVMDERARRDELKKLQSEEFGKVDNPEAIEASGAYVKNDDGSYAVKPDLLEGAAPEVSEPFRPTTERDATESFLRAGQAKGLVDPMQAMEIRGKAKQSELADLQLGEARGKANTLEQIGRNETAGEEELGRYDAARKAAQEEISGLAGATPEQINEITARHVGGLRMPEQIRYDISLKNARLLRARGDMEGAQRIIDKANESAASGFIRALVGGDYAAAAALYNVYPNGHRIAKILPGSEPGAVDVIDADGKVRRGMKVRDLVNAATEIGKPGTVASSLQKDEQYEQMLYRLNEQQRGREELAMLRAELRGASAGGGSRRPSGSREDGGDDPVSANTLSLKSFIGVLPESAKDVGIEAHSYYASLAQNTNPQAAADPRRQTEMIRQAIRLARGEAKPVPTFNQNTLGWDYGISDERGNPYTLDRNVNPIVLGVAEKDFKANAKNVVSSLEKNDPVLLQQAAIASQQKQNNGKTLYENLMAMDRAGAPMDLSMVRLMNAAHLYRINAGLPVERKDDRPEQSGVEKPGPLSMIGHAYGQTAKKVGDEFAGAFKKLTEYHPDYMR